MPGEVPLVRSVVAVAAGFFASNMMSAGADIAFRRTSPASFDAEGQPNSDATLLVIVAYEALFAVVAGYVTARLAIRKPFFHAAIMGALLLMGRLLLALLSWSALPMWFHLGVVVLALPAALLGAKIGELRSRLP